MPLTTEDIVSKVAGLPDENREALITDALQATAGLKWLPLPGPQTEAYFSPAHLTYYGGQGGGGKSSLLTGLALTAHRSSLLVRRQYTDLSALIDYTLETHGSKRGYNGAAPPRLTTDDGRIIDFGACARPGDETSWQGRPHDYLGIDEAAQLQEGQVRYLMGWVRTTVPGQRTRVVLASNPPLTAEGEWLTRMFAAWLDPQHPNPARSGELRWFATDENGKDMEVDGPEPVGIDGKIVEPLSRTFIRAALADNPYLMASGYEKTLDALPEPLRSAIRDGNFETAIEDDTFQIIPTAWVREAQDRWTDYPPTGQCMSSMGVDPAGGGRDETVIAMRYGGWFDKMVAVPGRETPMGSDVAGLVIAKRRHNCPVVIDMGGGYGSGVFEHLKSNGVLVYPHKGAERSNAKAKDRKLGFSNKRSEAWWLFREALDPDQPGGSVIRLPPDSSLVADLASTRFTTTTQSGRLVIQAERKEDVVSRLGRSPDRGDAIVMAFAKGQDSSGWRARDPNLHRPKVNRGYDARRRR